MPRLRNLVVLDLSDNIFCEQPRLPLLLPLLPLPPLLPLLPLPPPPPPPLLLL
jgi:hypothetical protein